MVGGPPRYYGIDRHTGEQRLLTAEETALIIELERYDWKRWNGKLTKSFDRDEAEAAVRELRIARCPVCTPPK